MKELANAEEMTISATYQGDLMNCESKFFSFAIAAFIALVSFSSARAALPVDPRTIPQIDFTKYSGLWKEIAHSPNYFQVSCLRSTAEYKLIGPGKVSVHNICYKAGTEISDIRGVATVSNPRAPGKLKVKFDHIPVAGDYWVVELDPNYQWAVVSGPGRKSLFILSRTTPLKSSLRYPLLRKLKQKGFDTSSLIFDKW